MSHFRFFVAACCMLLTAIAQGDDIALIDETLDSFHRAASRADTDAYLDAMTDNVVFLGTDGSERWQAEQFRAFVSDRFATGKGWTYSPLQREVTIAPDAHTAWFDESLFHESLGNCRGSGVLVRSASGWKIAQYNLSLPIPNDLVYQVAAEIAATRSGVAVSSASAVVAPATTDPEASSDDKPDNYKCSGRRFKTNRKAGC